MHDAGAEHLHPCTTTDTDVYFSGWLGEREVGGAKADITIVLIKKTLQKPFQMTHQVGKPDVSVHQQTLDLVKHR